MDLSARRHPLGHLAAQAARHQRHGPLKKQVVGVGPVAAADFVNVAKAARRDQGGLHPFALDHSIDGDGGAVKEERCPSKIGRRLGYGAHDPFGMIPGSGQDFRDGGTPVIVFSHQIGKGAADVYSKLHN